MDRVIVAARHQAINTDHGGIRCVLNEKKNKMLIPRTCSCASAVQPVFDRFQNMRQMGLCVISPGGNSSPQCPALHF